MARKFTIGLILTWTGAMLIAAGLMINPGRPATAGAALIPAGLGRLTATGTGTAAATGTTTGTATTTVTTTTAADTAGATGSPWAPAALTAPADLSDRLIRLHVVANSDSDADQALKRAVRDAILDEVTPRFVDVTTPDQARAAILAAMPHIEAAAKRVIAANGQTYPVQLDLGRHAFPGKAYGSLYLPAGQYNALRVLIGEAAGANWWCVLFPPMCFVDWSTGIVLEPNFDTGGKSTIITPRRKTPLLADEEQLQAIPVRPKLKVLEWIRGWSRSAEQVR